MTLGIRIAQRRKKLGLSQEALGERMGVSRQAISKWEADGAVPEIDKLIVLSRLFEVSVGWLLGIDEDPAEKSGGFTDEQLFMVEEIVKRYQQPRQETGRLRKALTRYGPALTLCASILALCLSATALWRLSDLRVQELWDEMSRVSVGQSQLQSWVEYLEKQTAAEDLFAEFAVTAQALEDRSGAKVRFTGTPESWNAQDTGILSVRREGQEVARGQCTWNGSVLEAEVELPAADGYEYYFLLLRQDGTQEQKNITGGIEDPSVINIAEGLSFLEEFSAYYTPKQWGWGYLPDNRPGLLRISNYYALIKIPALMEEMPALETVEVVLYKNGEEVERTPLEIGPYTVIHLEPDGYGGTIQRDEDVEGVLEGTARVDLLLENLTDGDFIEAVIEMKLSDGVVCQERVQTWDVSDAP